jgi:hypothetical protein
MVAAPIVAGAEEWHDFEVVTRPVIYPNAAFIGAAMD